MALTREQALAWLASESADAESLGDWGAKDYFDAIAAMLKADAALLTSATELKSIAREVTASSPSIALRGEAQ